MRDVHLRAIKQMARAANLLRERSTEQASRMRDKYPRYRWLEIDYLRRHDDRLRRFVPESLTTTEYHQELMEQCGGIASHATNVARVLPQQ